MTEDFIAMRDVVSALLVICDERELFAGADVQLATGLAERVRSRASLSVAQVRAAWRMLHRYREHASFPEHPPLPGAPPAQEDVEAAGSLPTYTARVVIRPDGRVGVHAPFAFKDALKGIAGARWDPRNKHWHIPASPTSCGELRQVLAKVEAIYPDLVTRLAAEYEAQDVLRAVLDPSTPVPDLPWPSWTKTAPWEHQKRGAVYLSESSAALLAVKMGGGKSLTAVSALNRAGARRVLIVCPSAVLGVWPNQFAEHSAIPWHVVNGLERDRNGRLRVIPGVANRFAQVESTLFDCTCGKPHAAVVNYEALTYAPFDSWKPVTVDGSPAVDVVIYDEAHRLRGRKTQNVCAKYRKWIARSWLMTGTPMPQSPLDVFGPFRVAEPGIYGDSRVSFEAKYAIKGGFENRQIVGIRNPEELARRFFQITYRPDVELNLPAVVDCTIEFDLEPAAFTIYEQLRKEAWAKIDEAARRASGLETASGAERTISPKNAAVNLLRLQQVTGGATKDDDGNTVVVSTAKRNALAELLPEVGCKPGGPDGASAPEPVVVFCKFKHDLAAVAAVAESAGLRYAEISGTRRDGLTAESKMTPDCDILGVQIQSGGTGIDLTRSAVGVWYSPGFSLSDYDQARARQHRPGQTRPVLYVHLTARNTVDAEVYAALEARQDVIAAVLATQGIEPTSREAVAEVEHGPETVSSAGMVAPLPPEIAKFAPNARLGLPTASARGNLAGTRAARQAEASVMEASVNLSAFGLDDW